MRSATRRASRRGLVEPLEATVPAQLTERAVMALMVAGGAYVAASLMANVMSVRILSLGGWAVDAGTLTYPLTFTLRDVVHKVGGTAVARTTVVATAGFNVMLALGLWAAAALPGDPATVGAGQSEFGNVLNPVLRITAASIIAQVIAELVDTEVYRAWVARYGVQYQWGRVLSSNAVSVPLDSVIFAVIAFAGRLPASVVWSIIVANIVIKGLTAVASTPLIYTVKDRWVDRTPPT
ncbi:MAG: queuosine precursor transporter [Candidatus Microthrix parvicella]